MKKSFKVQGMTMIIMSCLCWSIFSFYNTNSYQLFGPGLAEAKGIEFADLNLWNTWGGLIACLFTFLGSRIVSKVGARTCMSLGLIIVGLNYFFMPSYPVAMLGIGIIINDVMQVFYCNLSTNRLVASWYPRNQAVVMGWVTGAIMLGGLVYLPIFSRAMTNSGVGSAMRTFGIPVIALGVIAWLIIRNTPQEMGLEPDGKPMTEEEERRIVTKKNEKNPWTLKKVLTNKKLLAYSVGWGLEFIVLVGVTMVGIPILLSKGIEQDAAVHYAQFGAILSLLGSVVSGMIANKLGGQKTILGMMLIELISCACLLVGTGNTRFILLVGYFLALFLAGAPSNLTATGAIELVGARYLILAWGTIFMIINFMRSFASTFVSISLKITGGYNGALAVFCAIMVISMILIKYAGSEYQEPPFEPGENPDEIAEAAAAVQE